MLGRAVEVVVWWALLVGVWVLTLSSAPPVELAVAAAAALPCALAARAARRAMEGGWTLAPGWGRWLVVLPVAVLADSARLLFAGVRRIRGRGDLREVTTSAGEGARAKGHRALASLVLSATPSGFVVDTRPDDGVLVVHAVVDGRPRLSDRVRQ